MFRPSLLTLVRRVNSYAGRYSVNNNQPRPESYREDYNTATNKSYYAASGIIYPETARLNESEVGAVYANLATGAESGWDYGTRFLSRPNDALNDVYFPLRYLKVRDLIPVDLNAILYQNEVTIASFLELQGNKTGAKAWLDLAEARSQAIHAVLWNETLFSYFDYNLTSSSHFAFVPLDADATPAERAAAPGNSQVLFHIAQLYPFWTGAARPELKNNPLAVRRAYSRVASMLEEKAGGIPATNFKTGQQWDEPNVWPCLQHVLMEGLRRTPPTYGTSDPSYVAVQDLALRLAQRYLDSTFCTWYATGGSTSATPKLAGLGSQAVGIMFEKYGDNATNVAGSGGEYEVVEGFGWTNGVLIWAVDTFGNKLRRPNCGDIKPAHVGKRANMERRAVELDRWDAGWVKRFGKRALD